MNSSINAPFTWKTALSVVALATLIILLIGWLIISGALPVKLVIDYSDFARKFIQVWVVVAILIGLLIPGIAFFVWIRQKDLRKFLGLYLLVLIIQVLTEQVLSSVFPSIVVVIGSIYTALRLVQLWQGKQLMTTTAQLGSLSRRIMSSLWWLLLLFWASNLIMLSVLAWPSIL